MWIGDDVGDLVTGEWRGRWRLDRCGVRRRWRLGCWGVETSLETLQMRNGDDVGDLAAGTGGNVETWQMWSADDVGDLAAGEWR